MNMKQAIAKLSDALQFVKQPYTDKDGNKKIKYWLDGNIDSQAVDLLAPFEGEECSIGSKPYILRITRAGSEYKDNRTGYMKQRKSNSIQLVPNTREYVAKDSLLD